MVYEFFVFGTFWFWLLAAVALVGMFWSISKEAGGWASFVLLAFFTILALFGTFNVVSYSWNHPLHAAMVVGIYLLGGVPWATAKLWIWGKNLRDDLEEIQEDWLQGKGYNRKTLTTGQIEEWNNSIAKKDFTQSIGNTDGEVTPKIRNHKSKVISWMIYWPVSLLWTLFKDALKRLWSAVYHAIARKLQGVLNSVFKNADLAVPVEVEPSPATVSKSSVPVADWDSVK